MTPSYGLSLLAALLMVFFSSVVSGSTDANNTQMNISVYPLIPGTDLNHTSNMSQIENISIIAASESGEIAQFLPRYNETSGGYDVLKNVLKKDDSDPFIRYNCAGDDCGTDTGATGGSWTPMGSYPNTPLTPGSMGESTFPESWGTPQMNPVTNLPNNFPDFNPWDPPSWGPGLSSLPPFVTIPESVPSSPANPNGPSSSTAGPSVPVSSNNCGGVVTLEFKKAVLEAQIDTVRGDISDLLIKSGSFTDADKALFKSLADKRDSLMTQYQNVVSELYKLETSCPNTY